MRWFFFFSWFFGEDGGRKEGADILCAVGNVQHDKGEAKQEVNKNV